MLLSKQINNKTYYIREQNVNMIRTVRVGQDEDEDKGGRKE